MKNSRGLVLCAALLGTIGCERGLLGDAPGTDQQPGGDAPGGGQTPPGGDPTDPGEPTASANRTVVWKRYRAFEQDLTRGLDLTPAELCAELGSLNCVNSVHLASLGGHDPFTQGRETSLDEPVLTTPVAVDRVVLSACIARIDRDATGVPSVFTHYSLGGNATGSPAERDLVDAQNRTLYQRLLARDPIEAELAVLADLVVAGRSFRDIAIASCYAIGTSAEFIFL